MRVSATLRETRLRRDRDGARPGRCDEAGMVSPAVPIVIGLLTISFVAGANYVVFHYGRGALQSAVDQAAQAGSRAGAPPDACRRRADEALEGLLGGSLGDTVRVSCTDDGAVVRATATATFEGWLDIVPDRSVTVTATAHKEQVP